jgi:hypothetical protein
MFGAVLNGGRYVSLLIQHAVISAKKKQPEIQAAFWQAGE